ncbi:hypothetical protein Hanom_Chr12g01152851 [Helianthus anomalus]
MPTRCGGCVYFVFPDKSPKSSHSLIYQKHLYMNQEDSLIHCSRDQYINQ